jgi:hypothetical protein
VWVWVCVRACVCVCEGVQRQRCVQGGEQRGTIFVCVCVCVKEEDLAPVDG